MKNGYEMSDWDFPQIIELVDGTKCVRLEDFKKRDTELEREWPPFAATLCSPTTTWVCPACGRWYQTIRQRDELPIHAKRRCTEQHIEDGCRATKEAAK